MKRTMLLVALLLLGCSGESGYAPGSPGTDSDSDADSDSDTDTDTDVDSDADSDTDTDTDSDTVCPYDCLGAIVCSSVGVVHAEYTCPDSSDVCCEESGTDTDTDTDTGPGECALTCQEHAYQCVTGTVTIGTCPEGTPFCCEPASTDTDTDTDSDTDTDTDSDTDTDTDTGEDPCTEVCISASGCGIVGGTVVDGACSYGVCCDLGGGDTDTDVDTDTELEACPEMEINYACMWPGECTIAYPAIGIPDDSYYCTTTGAVCCHCFSDLC